MKQFFAAAAHWFFVIFGLKAWQQRLYMTNRRVSLDQATFHLSVLRGLVFAMGSVVLIVGGLAAWRWPRYRAEGLRVLVQRDLAQAVIGQKVYLAMAEAIQADVLNLAKSPEGYTPQGLQSILSRHEMRQQMVERAAVQSVVVARADVASKGMPQRLKTGALWADPLSGYAMPEGIEREEAIDRLVRHWLASPEHNKWRTAVASTLHVQGGKK